MAQNPPKTFAIHVGNSKNKDIEELQGCQATATVGCWITYQLTVYRKELSIKTLLKNLPKT